MTARESVARAWHAGSDHAAETPFGGPLCNCWQVAGRIMPMLAGAWSEGVKVAQREAKRELACERPRPLINPYETKEGRHVDQ